MEMDEWSSTQCWTYIHYPKGHLKAPHRNVASVVKETEAHLAIAGEGGVVKQEVGTKEEGNSVKHTQACPVQENRPAKEGVLRYVSEKEGIKKQFCYNIPIIFFLLTGHLGVKHFLLTCTRRAPSSMSPWSRVAPPDCRGGWGVRWSWCCTTSNMRCRTEAAKEQTTQTLSGIRKWRAVLVFEAAFTNLGEATAELNFTSVSCSFKSKKYYWKYKPGIMRNTVRRGNVHATPCACTV